MMIALKHEASPSAAVSDEKHLEDHYRASRLAGDDHIIADIANRLRYLEKMSSNLGYTFLGQLIAAAAGRAETLSNSGDGGDLPAPPTTP